MATAMPAAARTGGGPVSERRPSVEDWESDPKSVRPDRAAMQTFPKARKGRRKKFAVHGSTLPFVTADEAAQHAADDFAPHGRPDRPRGRLGHRLEDRVLA